MGNFLIRGLSPRVRRRIQERADSENLSVNQYVLQRLNRDIEETDTEEEKQRRQKEAFRRIDEIREEIYRKHGLSDDSVKIIREFREGRER